MMVEMSEMNMAGFAKARTYSIHCTGHCSCCKASSAIVRPATYIPGKRNTLWVERERGNVVGQPWHGAASSLRLLPPEMNWAYRMRSQSSASNLLCWSCAHWRVASDLFHVPLSAVTLRAENWALIRVLRSVRLRWL